MHHEGIPTSDRSSFMSSLAIPRNNHTSHRTIQEIKMTERNNLEHGSGKHLTLGKMTTISLSVGNLFWGKRKPLPRDIFFVCPNFSHLFFAICHERKWVMWLRIFWKLWDPVYLPPASRSSLTLHYWDHWDTECSYLLVPRQGYQLWPTEGIKTSDLTQTGGK